MSTAVEVNELPKCDLCPENRARPAAVDGKTVMGPWANMCENHWAEFGVGRLGTGYGQRLFLRKQKP